MSTVKPPILRNAITEASPNFLAFPLWLFWQRGDFFWAVAFSEMRIEDTPSELILLRGKMWRCSVFANYTASPAAFSKARFVKLPRPRICSLHFFFNNFLKFKGSLEPQEDNLGKHEKETFSLDGKELFHFYFSGESWKCTERYFCENIKLGSEWETLYNFSFKAPLWENLGILNWPGPVRVGGE